MQGGPAVLYLLHMLGLAAFFAGAAVGLIGQCSARNRRRPSEIALLLGLGRWGMLLVGIGALSTFVTGIWMVAIDSRSAFQQTWVVASLVLFFVALLVGGLGGRPAKRMRLHAQRLADDADLLSEELVSEVRSPWALASSAVTVAILVVITGLMIWKPGQPERA